MKFNLNPKQVAFLKSYAKTREVEGKPMTAEQALSKVLEVAEGRISALKRYGKSPKGKAAVKRAVKKAKAKK